MTPLWAGKDANLGPRDSVVIATGGGMWQLSCDRIAARRPTLLSAVMAYQLRPPRTAARLKGPLWHVKWTRCALN